MKRLATLIVTVSAVMSLAGCCCGRGLFNPCGRCGSPCGGACGGGACGSSVMHPGPLGVMPGAYNVGVGAPQTAYVPGAYGYQPYTTAMAIDPLPTW